MRDTAIRGLVRLLTRPEWKASADTIAVIIAAALHDNSPVVRMSAAYAARALHASMSPPERVNAVGDLLLEESDPIVQTVLVGLLPADVAVAPPEVDGVLESFTSSLGEDGPDAKGDLGRAIIHLLTHLAVVDQTRFAARTVRTWMESAPSFADESQVVAQFARGYLRPNAEATQARAFQLLTLAADAALERWNRNPEERLANTELSDIQRAELEGAVSVADTIADQVYFASGAFAHKQENGPAAGPDHAAFANLAFPVLATCARLQAPPSIHHVVETMSFLSPLDEKRALLAIAEAVPSDGSYTRDNLAADVVIPYLVRLLAEQRQLVLFDDEGVEAFRHLLAAFATAGNESALSLAFTFSDIFR